MAEQLSFLADEQDEEHPLRAELCEGTRLLAEQGVFIGTSSWKYEGWLDLIYNRRRYSNRGRFSKTRFNADCLTEYAETFPTVCVDAGLYRFPTERYITGLMEQVPRSFKFSFKVTEDITLRHFPQIERLGNRAGKHNPNFLNAELFAQQFLRPLEAHRDQVGLLIFQFSRLPEGSFDEVLEQLDTFFAAVPTGWDYALEIRNPELLADDYLSILEKRRVGHVFNSWEAMTPIDEQLDTIGDRLVNLHGGSRLLLSHGRNYKTAVDKFSPYREVKAVNERVRKAAVRMMQTFIERKNRIHAYGNNRLEGCAPITLANIILRLREERS